MKPETPICGFHFQMGVSGFRGYCFRKDLSGNRGVVEKLISRISDVGQLNTPLPTLATFLKNGVYIASPPVLESSP